MAEGPTVSQYKSRQSHVIGALLVTIGCMSIVFNLVDIGIAFDLKDQTGLFVTSLQSLGYIGHGFWNGVMCIVAGSLGVVARHKNQCKVTAFMVSCVICVFTCAAQTGIGLAGAALCSQRGQESYGCATGGRDVRCEAFHSMVAMEALLCIIGAIAFVLSIWGACIAGAGRRHSTSKRDSSLPVSFTSAAASSPRSSTPPPAYSDAPMTSSSKASSTGAKKSSNGGKSVDSRPVSTTKSSGGGRPAAGGKPMTFADYQVKKQTDI